jgi:murein DD-endopeptidase MepM/ murein hydrolase activator NlpD
VTRAFLLLFLIAGVAQAAPKPGDADPAAALARARHAEQAARAQSRAYAAQAALLAEQQVQAAANLRRLEDQTDDDTQRLAALQASAAAARATLDHAVADLDRLLPIMARLHVAPAATLFAVPQTPEQALQSLTILQGISAQIAAAAADVKARDATLKALTAQTMQARDALLAAVQVQETAEQKLNQQVQAARAAEMSQADLAARAAAQRLAAQRELDSLAAAASLAAPGRDIRPPNGGGAPVAGHIALAYGAATAAGPAQGISYAAAPGARVVTPCAGTVLYAGALPEYGLIVIADCGGGSSVVLAGMHHLDVATGQRLAHGQPVGTMLGFAPDAPTRQPILYVELRQNGQPVDPSGWLRQ